MIADSRAENSRSVNRSGRLLRLAAALAFVGFVATPGWAQAAGRVFSDNFENGSTSKWSSDSDRSRCTATTSSVDGVAPRGSSMLSCNWNGAVAWNDPASYSTLALKSWNYNSEYLIRFWLRYATDVDRVIGNKVLRLYPGDSKNSFYMNAQMEKSGGPMFSYWEQINGSSGPTFWGDAPLGDGKWHKVEIYVKHNTSGSSNGIIRVWQDGALKQQATNVVFTSGVRWYPLYLMSNWSSNPGWEHDANNHVYWDDFEIYSDAGSGASGSMADATISATTTSPTPAPPQSVTVQ